MPSQDDYGTRERCRRSPWPRSRLLLAFVRDDGTLWAFRRAPGGDAAPACVAVRFFARNKCLKIL